MEPNFKRSPFHKYFNFYTLPNNPAKSSSRWNLAAGKLEGRETWCWRENLPTVNSWNIDCISIMITTHVLSPHEKIPTHNFNICLFWPCGWICTCMFITLLLQNQVVICMYETITTEQTLLTRSFGSLQASNFSTDVHAFSCLSLTDVWAGVNIPLARWKELYSKHSFSILFTATGNAKTALSVIGRGGGGEMT